MGKLTLAGALARLDPANDDHWTNAGLVRLDALSEIMGEPIKREDLQEHGPEGFERDTAKDFEWEGIDLGNDEPQGPALEAEKKVVEAMDAEEPDAIKLIEAFCAAVQTDRFRRNHELQALARQWAMQQVPAKTLQDRIDKRNKERFGNS